MNPVPLFLIIVTLPLLLGGCGEKPVVEVKPVEEAPINSIKYKITGDEVAITDYDTEASGALTIPATIEGNPVTSIWRDAFNLCYGLTSITIPDSVTSIEAGAFNGCTKLTNITIPDGVTSIPFGTFLDCPKLTSITIPDSVISIGVLAFSECKGLSSVTFLGDAPKVGTNIFLEATPTIYRKPEAKGWGDTFAGRPVKLISKKP